MTVHRFTRPILAAVPVAVLAAAFASSTAAAGASSTPPATASPASSAPVTSPPVTSPPVVSVPVVSAPASSPATTSTPAAPAPPSASGTPSAPVTPPARSASAATTPAATAPAAPAATGPDYSCSSLFGTEPYGSFTGRIPLSVTVTGPHTVGATDRVTVTGNSPEFVSSWPHADQVTVTGSLAATGSQSGSVTLSEQGIAASSNPLQATGTLRLTRAGVVHLHLPRLIQQVFSLEGPPGQDTGTHHCELLTRPAPVAVVLHVTGPAATTSASPSASPSPSVSLSRTGVPAGAPATGGGPGPGRSGSRLALAGLVLLLGGGTTTVAAVRSRTPRKAR